MSQCSPQKAIAGKLLLQSSALQNFGQAKNYMNDNDEIVGGGSFSSNNMGIVGANAQNIDQHIKQLSSTSHIQQQEALKNILQFASNDGHILKQHLKTIVSNCSVILRESIGNSLKSEIKNIILSLYEIFLSRYIEDSELLIGNEISLILLNLGDEQAGIRRKCHQLLLKYIRTYQNSEILVKVFLTTGFQSENWIVRQKSINSLHSILVSESKNISWNSPDLVDLTVSSIHALNDDNVHVQKATEQLLVQFTKCEQFQIVCKKLSREVFEKLKKFVEGQQLLGNIPPTYSLDSINHHQSAGLQYSMNNAMNSQIQQKQNDQFSTPFQHKFASLGQNIIQNSYQTNNPNNNSTIPKSSSSIIHKNQSNTIGNSQGKDMSPIKPMTQNDTINHTLEINQIRSDVSLQMKNNPDLHFGFISDQIYNDLLDEKDWRARASAVEDINSQIDNIQEFPILFEKLEEFIQILIKLINDTNFKISLTALQIVCKISKHESFNNPYLLDQLIPQIVSKLGDSKVAIRTQVIKIMREHIKLFGQYKWLDGCLSNLRSKNANAKEEVLNLVTQLYTDIPVMVNYNWDKVLREVAPLIDDQKTKIKIKCVDCMVMVTMKNNKESCKKLIATLFNKVYNEMFLEKLQQKIVEKSQEDAYLSSHQTSIYSTNNKTNESFRQRENDLKFNFIDGQGNLAQSGAGSFHFNYKQFDADTSHTNSFRTQMTSTTPEKYQMHGQNQQGQSIYNPTLQGFGQQTQYTNTQSQFGYPFEPSSSNLFGSLISPMQTQNRILSQNDVIDISLFSQSHITEDGQIFRSNNNQQRDFSSYSVYRQNPNQSANYTISGSGNKQPHSSSSSVRGFSNQEQMYQQSSMNEIGRTPDSRFSQRTTNTMSTSSNTMFPQIVNNQNKGGYSGYSQGLLEISTSSSSRSAVKPGLSQSNNMNPILGNSQLTGVEQLKLSRQNIRGMGGNGYDSSYQNSINTTPYSNNRGNSSSFSSNYQGGDQYIQKDYSPLKTNIEEVQYSFNENRTKVQGQNLPPLPPSRKISQTEQPQLLSLDDEQPSFSAKKISKQQSQPNNEEISKPKSVKKQKEKDKTVTSLENGKSSQEEESENQEDDENKIEIEKEENDNEEDNDEEGNEDGSEEDEDEEEEEKEDEEEEEEEKEENEEEEEEQEGEQEEEDAEVELEDNEDEDKQELESESNENSEESEKQSESASEEKEENSSEDNSDSVRQKSQSQSSSSQSSEDRSIKNKQNLNFKKKKSTESEEQQQNKSDKQKFNEYENKDIILNYTTQKNLEEFTMSTFDKQIKESYPISQSSNSNQGNAKPNNAYPGKVAVKNKEFNPPLNLYKGNNNNQEDNEEKTPTTYQYKPYLMKKSKRLSVDQSQQQATNNEQSNQPSNQPQSVSLNSISDPNSNLVIESREYIFKNPPTINEDPNENSPNSLSTKVPTKNIFKRPKRNSGSISNKDEIQENEEEEDKKILKPNLRNLKKKVNLKQANSNEQQLPPQPTNQKQYSAFDAQKQSYLTKAELEPLQNPESTLKYILADLKVDDWSRQFDGLNNLRRINQHHADLLNNQVLLHNLMTEVLKLVENLRSSLAKNAMITLTELVEKLKRTLDTECEAIVTKLLKKGLDANSFILEEVKNALVTVSSNCSEYKIVSIIASKYQHKAISFKMSIALMLYTLIEKSSNKILQVKDVDKLLFVLSLYTMDGALEVRNYAKKTFSLLLSNTLSRSEIDKILVRMLSDQQYQKIKQFIEKESKNPEQLYISGTQNKNVKGMSKGSCVLIPSSNNSSQLIPSGSISASVIPAGSQKNQSSTSSIQDDALQTQEIDEKAMKASSMPTMKNLTLKQTQSVKLKDPQEFENIPQYFALCDNQDWKQRIEGVQKLTDIALNYPEQIAKSKYSNKFFDNFMTLLNDSNSKVSNSALSQFLNVVSSLKSGIEANLPVVFNSVCQAIGSTLSSNKLLGEQIYAKIAEVVEPGQLFSQLCNGASFAPVKAKQLIIKTLIDQGQEMYEKKGALFVKQTNSAISKLLDDNKPELRPLCKQLIIKVHQIIGNQIFDGASAAKKKVIQDHLAAN